MRWARVWGYHDDARSFTRLRVEAAGVASYATLRAAWEAGRAAKAAGVQCSCVECVTSNLL